MSYPVILKSALVVQNCCSMQDEYVLWTILACYKGGSTHQDENRKAKIVQPFFAIKEKQCPYPIILTPTPLPHLPTPAPGNKWSLTRK